jgi:hypothetical protein
METANLTANSEYTDPAGSQFYITLRYTITIADTGVEFVSDEVAYGVEEPDWMFQE